MVRKAKNGYRKTLIILGTNDRKRKTLTALIIFEISLQWWCTRFKLSPKFLKPLLSITNTNSTNDECLFALYGPCIVVSGDVDRLY